MSFYLAWGGIGGDAMKPRVRLPFVSTLAVGLFILMPVASPPALAQGAGCEQPIRSGNWAGIAKIERHAAPTRAAAPGFIGEYSTDVSIRVIGTVTGAQGAADIGKIELSANPDGDLFLIFERLRVGNRTYTPFGSEPWNKDVSVALVLEAGDEQDDYDKQADQSVGYWPLVWKRPERNLLADVDELKGSLSIGGKPVLTFRFDISGFERAIAEADGAYKQVKARLDRKQCRPKCAFRAKSC